ncbi:MAG: ATP-binding protein [bacterium]|nr:ATP-binding protein [bacterium]
MADGKDRRIAELEAELADLRSQYEHLGRHLETQVQMQSEALHESEDRFRALFNSLQEGVCLLDADHRLLLANPSAQVYLPILTSVGVGGIVHTVGDHRLADVLKAEEGQAAHEVVVKETPERIFEVQGYAVGQQTKDEGWVLVMREVTREREVLERIQLRDRLAAVGQLAAGIAHDFNNILGVIMGYAELLEMREDLPEKVRRNLQVIYLQSERGAQLIRQILDFSRQTSAQKQPLDLVPLLKEVTELLERTLPENIQLTGDFQPGEYVLNANLTQVQQVITNLAVNARDAMPDGGRLTFGLSWLEVGPGERRPIRTFSSRVPLALSEGKWIVFLVSDTGIGIPEDAMARLFEPFFTTKQPGKGTGLGLAQVYGIVKQHGGYIEVDSEVGVGTTFTLYFRSVAETAVAIEPMNTAEIVHGEGEKVLVVEDDPAVLEVIGNLLESLDYLPLKALNGREALDLYDIHGKEIAALVTDVVMPEMSGVELALELQKRNPNIGVVMITGHPVAKREDSHIPEKIHGFLEKPIEFRELAQVVKKATTKS